MAMVHVFENYFDRVTKGKYRQYYPAMRKNFDDADRMFYLKYNIGILHRPDMHSKYIKMLMDAMRVDGAPEPFRREVSKRLREFARLNFNA